MTEIILHLPEETALLLRVSADEVGRKLQMAAAAKLYEMGELSSGAAARLAGVSAHGFSVTTRGLGH